MSDTSAAERAAAAARTAPDAPAPGEPTPAAAPSGGETTATSTGPTASVPGASMAPPDPVPGAPGASTPSTAAPATRAGLAATRTTTILHPVPLSAPVLASVSLGGLLGALFLGGAVTGTSFNGPASSVLVVAVLAALWSSPALILLRALHSRVTVTPDAVTYETLRWTREVPRSRISAVRVTGMGVSLLGDGQQAVLSLGNLWEKSRASELVSVLGVERVGRR